MNSTSIGKRTGFFAARLGLGTVLAAVVSVPASTWAGPLAQLERNGIKVSVVEDKGKVTIQVHSGSKVHANVFGLVEPGRIVIDIPGKRFQRTDTLEIEGNDQVTGLRFGSHADKARIVVDLATVDEPKFAIDDSSTGLRVVLGAERSAPPAKQVVPTAAPQPTATRVAPPTRMPVPPTVAPVIPTRSVPTSVPTTVPTVRPTAVPTVAEVKAWAVQPEVVVVDSTKIVMKGNEPVGAAQAEKQANAPSTSGQALQAILFERNPDNGEPLIKLRFSSRPRFLMTKSSERAYRLVVPDITLAGDQLALPFFPPQDFKGFTVVRAETRAKDVEIMIGVERGGRITPTTKDSEVWIQLAQQ